MEGKRVEVHFMGLEIHRKYERTNKRANINAHFWCNDSLMDTKAQKENGQENDAGGEHRMKHK